MYQIAICDDEKETLEFIKKILVESFISYGFPVAVDTFENGTEFLKMFHQHYHYDAIFLDIDMPKIDGIEVCRRIRLTSRECICIFISNKDELVFQTFEVQPFRFVRKTDLINHSHSLVQAVITEWKRCKTSSIQFIEPRSGDIFSFEISSILYVEAQRKKLKIVTDLNETLIEMKFMQMENQLNKQGFLKPHRSFLVNCRHIFRINKEGILLKNGNLIPISRNRLDSTRTAFIQYYSEGML